MDILCHNLECLSVGCIRICRSYKTVVHNSHDHLYTAQNERLPQKVAYDTENSQDIQVIKLDERKLL